MANIEQIYRDNLALLIKEAGSQKKLADKTEKSAAQLSQWLNASKDPKTGKPRAMSRQTARQLEKKCGKPEGWMDQSHAPGLSAATESKGGVFRQPTPEDLDLLDEFLAMDDTDQQEIAAEIQKRAAKMRALTSRVLEKYGVTSLERRAANASKQALAKAAVKPSPQLKQRSLLDDQGEGEP